MGKKYIIKVETNPAYCGIGAGGVQFANGQAVIGEGHMVDWFKEHEGYSVTSETPEDPLDEMTVAELKAFAESKGVDLGKAAKKEEILTIIRAAVAE